MTRLLPTPSLWRRAAAVLHQNNSTLCRTSNTPASAFRPVQAGAKYGALAAMSDSVSRSSNPLTAAYRGVAHLFLTGMSALPADQRRTDEASRHDWANPTGSSGVLRPLCPHRRLSAVLLRGSLSALSNLGSIPGQNLVGLDPQSKRFFSHQECGGVMAMPAKRALGRYLQDRAVAPVAQALWGQKSLSRR